MIKRKLFLLAALILGGVGVSSAATWKSVLASTTGATQAGMTGYALNIGSGTISNLIASTITASASNLQGTAKGSQYATSAEFGFKGSSTTQAATSLAGSNTYSDIVSTTLPAGNWWIYGCLSFTLNGATASSDVIVFSGGTSSGDNTTGVIVGQNFMHYSRPTSSDDNGGCTPGQLVSPTSSTTYYLKGREGYSSGPVQAVGTLVYERKP